jgi:hypothetical protein
MSRFQLLADSDSGTGLENLQNLSENERLILRERRNDEVEAIQAIYGDDVSINYDDENGGIEAWLRLFPFKLLSSSLGFLNYASRLGIARTRHVNTFRSFLKMHCCVPE